MIVKTIKKTLICTLLVSVCLFAGCSTSEPESNSNAKETISDKSKRDKSPNDSTKEFTYKSEDFTINGIGFDSKYDEVIKAFGKPMKVINIEDKTLITLKGYFSILVYDGIEIIVSCGNSGFETKNAFVAQIDVVSNKFKTSKGLSINNSIERAKELYKVDKIYDFKKESNSLDDVSPILNILNRFRKDKTYETYNKGIYIESEPSVPARCLTFLAKENKIYRIVITNHTAG